MEKPLRISAFAIAAFISAALAGASAQDQAGLDPQIVEEALSKGAALVLPVSALAVPEVAATVSPIIIDPETKIAMEGFDPVGYFTEGKAMKGDKAFMAEYQGAMFLFATAAHRDLFTANPERYAPAFGGYCTKTIAAGALTPASPLNWTIHGDRLFLTRSPAANEAFRAEREEIIEAGDRYWADASDAFMTGLNAAAHRE